MEETRYGLRVDLSVPYDEALSRATAALQAEGFGVLTTIDVQQTLKQKLNRDFRKYTILGACNPPLADRALHAELEIGLLLPCNVVVYERDLGTSSVAAMAPLPAMGIVGNKDLQDVAREADSRLRNALRRLVAYDADPRIPMGPEEIGGSVAGAVVDDDDLEIDVLLSEYRTERSLQMPHAVVGRHDDGDLGGHAAPPGRRATRRRFIGRVMCERDAEDSTRAAVAPTAFIRRWEATQRGRASRPAPPRSPGAPGC